MLISTLAAVTLSATTPLKLALTTLNTPGMDASRAEFFTEHLGDRLTDRGVEVISPREISAMLGLERQRQLLGCDESSSCVAELAGALGVQGVVLGDLARVGTVYQVNLKVLSSQSTKRVATFSVTVNSEEELIPALTRGAQELAAQVAKAFGVELAKAPVPEPAPTPAAGVRRWWWLPGVVFVAAGAGGAVGLVVAEDRRQFLVNAINIPSETARTAYSDGVLARTLGWVGVGVGIAALGTSAAFLLFGGSPPVTPTVSWTNNGANFGLTGTF